MKFHNSLNHKCHSRHLLISFSVILKSRHIQFTRKMASIKHLRWYPILKQGISGFRLGPKSGLTRLCYPSVVSQRSRHLSTTDASLSIKVLTANFGRLAVQENRVLAPANIFPPPSRSIVTCSKKGKRKTCKAVAKRFKRVGNGLLKRWQCGRRHLMRNKRARKRQKMRKPVYVTGNQLKKLNKMLSGRKYF